MAGTKKRDGAYAKGAQVGKNTEKGGFRENYPGHGCTNEVIFTQVCKGKKNRAFYHNP